MECILENFFELYFLEHMLKLYFLKCFLCLYQVGSRDAACPGGPFLDPEHPVDLDGAAWCADVLGREQVKALRQQRRFGVPLNNNS